MGVRGLTTFIYSNSNKYFENCKLQNCDLVIDGNCLLTILFYNSITNTAAFGGDYDKYAKATEQFFIELLKCHINPVVIFDGGYEKKKLDTVCNRNKHKVLSLANVGPTSHSKVCFPLMMRQVFRDKLREMDILFAQSDFEADSEIAALARKRGCPVLSSDSDFFIFDVIVIPISEFPLKADLDDDGTHYMSCKVYRVEKFLTSLGGLPKSHLPLLATLLGNDYISPGIFANFYSQMKITRGKKQSQIHCRVQSIISWLKKESFESALKKILWHLKKKKQRFVAMKVGRTIHGYLQVSTPLDSYLTRNEQAEHCDIKILNVQDILVEYDNIEGCDEVTDGALETNDNEPVESNESENESRIIETFENTNATISDTGNNDENEPKNKSASMLPGSKINKYFKGTESFPSWLVVQSRQGDLPCFVFTLLSLKIYFCVPQVENYEMSHAGEIGLPVLSKIAGILLGDDIYSYYYRTNKSRYASRKIPTETVCGKKKLPTVFNLYYLNCSQRKKIFCDVFEIDADALNVIESFPEQWHLFMFSLIFWSRNIKELNFQSHYLHSVITMILCIRVIESKIGYFRTKRSFLQRYASKIKKSTVESKSNQLNNCDSILKSIENIPLDECLNAFEIFLPYFQVEERLKTSIKLFSKSTIHAFAQLQVCLDLAFSFNSLLQSPFETLPMYNFFNSTFLYNFCTNFKKRTNIDAYIETLLLKCPSLLCLYKIIVERLSNFVTLNDKCPTIKKKKRRKKVTKEPEIHLLDEECGEEFSSYSDEDNTFALLSKLSIK